jgi:hypothetical protein
MPITFKQPHIPNVPRILQKVGEIAVDVTHGRVLAWAHVERDRFVNEVKGQRFRSFDIHPLTPRYYRRKVSKRADRRVMIATGHMLRKIDVFERRDSRFQTTIHVGFHRLSLARDLDNHVVPYPLYKVALVQEKGSRKMKIPPRPHWKIHLDAMRGRAVDLRRLIQRDIRSESLRRIGAPLRGR